MQKDFETAHLSSHELAGGLVIDRAYVLIIGGREYNVYIEEIGGFYIFGRVAQNKVVVLIDRPGRGGAAAKVVSPQEEKGAVGPGDELLHSEPCVVPSKNLHIRIKLESIDIVEDPWRPLLRDDVFSSGIVNPEALCKAIPAFKPYYVDGVGFSGSPDAWLQNSSSGCRVEPVQSKETEGVVLRLVGQKDDEDDSSSVE